MSGRNASMSTAGFQGTGGRKGNAGGRTRRDIFSERKRSLVMSRIRSKFTSLDIKMEGVLKRAGLRFQMYPKEFGSPDFIVGNRVAVFCDSSFWHGRNWRKLRKRLLEGNRPEYWVEHIGRNRARDRLVTKKLVEKGLTVVRLWDTDIQKRPETCVNRLRRALENDRNPRRKSKGREPIMT